MSGTKELIERLLQRAAGYQARGDTIYNGAIIAEELRAWAREAAALQSRAEPSELIKRAHAFLSTYHTERSADGLIADLADALSTRAELTEEEVAKACYAAEYDIVEYPWETRSAEERACYLRYGRAVLAASTSPRAERPTEEEIVRAVERAANGELFTLEELEAVNKLGDVVCDYIERCRTKLQLDGGIRAGVDGHLRKAVLPMLSSRARAVLSLLPSRGESEK